MPRDGRERRGPSLQQISTTRLSGARHANADVTQRATKLGRIRGAHQERSSAGYSQPSALVWASVTGFTSLPKSGTRSPGAHRAEQSYKHRRGTTAEGRRARSMPPINWHRIARSLCLCVRSQSPNTRCQHNRLTLPSFRRAKPAHLAGAGALQCEGAGRTALRGARPAGLPMRQRGCEAVLR